MCQTVVKLMICFFFYIIDNYLWIAPQRYQQLGFLRLEIGIARVRLFAVATNKHLVVRYPHFAFSFRQSLHDV